MQVFISWSGEISKALTFYLHEWLPTVVQRAVPWMSERDIEAGQRWNVEIASRLNEIDIGIICLTPENLNAPWLLFEAGAVAKAIDNARVIPVLFGLRKSDLRFPLALFQAVECERDGFFELVFALNNRLGTEKLTTALNTVFNGLWPNPEASLSKLQNEPIEGEENTHRNDREVLEDILEGVFTIQRGD